MDQKILVSARFFVSLSLSCLIIQSGRLLILFVVIFLWIFCCIWNWVERSWGLPIRACRWTPRDCMASRVQSLRWAVARRSCRLSRLHASPALLVLLIRLWLDTFEKRNNFGFFFKENKYKKNCCCMGDVISVFLVSLVMI